MTRKKSNVKALALAVTCAILAGGGIGLEPVYAADALTLYKEDSGNVTTSAKKNETTDNVVINELTVGGVTIGSETAFTGIKVGDPSSAEYVMITKTDVHATNSLIAPTITTGLARMEKGNIIAKDSLCIGYEYNGATGKNENIKFEVDGSNGSFKAAGNKFAVDDKGAITANSLMLAENYDVKTNIEDAKNTITTVEGNVTTNQNNIATLTGRVNDHATDIGALKTKTEGITRVGGNSTTVEGVNFKEGAVSGVKSINDNLKFEPDGIYLNKGDQTKQIKIDADGKIIIGTSSSAYDTNGFYAGGDDYDAAKAGMKSDGSLKATGFAVDGVTGAATFARETTFAGGIKTDTISENTPEAGVTVDNVVLKDGGITAAGDNFTVNGVTGDVTTKGALKGKTLGIGIDNDKFTVNENGAVKAAGGKVEIDNSGKATFGENANNRTTIAGKLATFGENTSTDYTTINGGKLNTYDLTVRNDMTVKNFKADNITSNNRITVGEAAREVYLDANGTLSLGVEENKKLERTQLANINNTIKANRVIEADSATIGDVEIKGGNVTTTTGTITGKTISDNVGATLTGGKITANEGKIGNVEIKAGVVTGVNRIEAQAFKVDDDNYLNSTGIKANSIAAKGGKIGEVLIEGKTLNIGETTLDKATGIATNKLTIVGMTLTDTKLDTGNAPFYVNGVKFNDGQVTAKASEGFVAGTSSFKEHSLIVDDNNKLDATNGLTTQKATVTGTLDVKGKATFGIAGQQTTIEGDAITTNTLTANRLILGTSGTPTVEVDKNGSLIAAGGAFKVDKDGKTTFKKDADNLSSINGGNIWAKATDAANSTSSELLHNYKGLHISGTQAGQTSAFDFDAATGISTFTGQDETTTTVNGSVITSTKSATDTGVLDGSNLTLKKGTNQTVLDAGKVTFTGENGRSDATGVKNQTTINGGIITTDTLNVKRIELGGKLVDENGTELGSNLSMDNQGNFTAAGGNFMVTGGNEGSRGSITNVVGDDASGKTSFTTNQQGAKMSFKKGGVMSNVSVADGTAKVSAGAGSIDVTNDSITNKVGTNVSSIMTSDSITDRVGGTFVETKDGSFKATGADGNGMEIDTNTGTTTFTGKNYKDATAKGTTVIDGNEITTGKITTDELVITGKGDAAGDGTGSLAFGGNGTIKSDVKKDGSTNNTQFTTDINGVNTMVTNGQTTTENKVTAKGNSNTVKQDNTHKSEFNQGLTSIGGVVTNGEIKVAQYLDGETGLLTNEVKDAKGSSMLVQNGSGLEYTDSANDKNATRINSSDVSIGSATNDKDRINLSDLGQIDNLDTELTARKEYTDNQTAVGGINAEAAIRREEVARLDGRINDVNDRVNKVGAMAAAIASLKSIGYDPQAPSEFSIGLGQYKGETGVAMGFFHYPNKNFMINVSLSTAGGETMGGIGATWRFGHKSPQKLLEEQREAQAKKELAAAEKYQAAAKLAKEAQERAEYAAKLARQAQVSADNAKAAADATQAKHFG